MSEIMKAILRLPEDLFWSDDPVSRHQHEQIRREAANRLEALERWKAEITKAVESEGTVATGYIVGTEQALQAYWTDYYQAREQIVKLEAEEHPND